MKKEFELAVFFYWQNKFIVYFCMFQSTKNVNLTGNNYR